MTAELKTIDQRLITWFLSGDSGVSSETIVAVMTGNTIKGTRVGYPRDSSDLGRCLRLLGRVPEFRDRLSELSKVSPCWGGLAKHWQLLEGLYATEEASERRRNTSDAVRMINTAYGHEMSDVRQHMKRLADLTMNRVLALFQSLPRSGYRNHEQWVDAVHERAVAQFTASGATPKYFPGTPSGSNPLIGGDFNLADEKRPPSIVALSWAIELQTLRPKIEEVIRRREEVKIRRPGMV